jgi:ferredoxin
MPRGIAATPIRGMTDKKKSILLCDCEHSMPIDADAIAAALGLDQTATINTQLCRAQLENFQAAVAGGDPFVAACTQEAPFFSEVLGEAENAPEVTFTNIRERAGWSAEAGDATPKIAALLAEAVLDKPPVPTVTMSSEGVCLVYGRDEAAIEAARQLSGRLEVTVLLTGTGEIAPPRVMDLPIFRGTIAGARGHLGAFEIVVNGYAPIQVSSKAALGFEATRDGASSRCDLILDLTGDAPLFSAGERRDGYFQPDPNDPVAVQRALFELADLVGEFEKPRYVQFDGDLCAHSRSRQTGCTRCLDVCPVSAITPNGDTVAIDPFVCGGCGACNSVCPTGAASYAMPPQEVLLDRLRTMMTTYFKAGGDAPALLVHDDRHGEDIVSMMARHGRGLPARVIPFTVNEVTQIGFDFLSSAIAYGAQQVVLMVPPERRDELDGLAGQIGLLEAVSSGLGFGSGRAAVLTDADPDVVERQLFDLPKQEAVTPGTYIPLGGKRTVTRLALHHLRSVAPTPVDEIALPQAAPFGAVNVDAEGCTLCLACVGACPTGAMQDNPELPQLRFQEDACIQCGLCRNTCPENVITLQPRLNFAEDARRALVLKEEEPYECVRCGKPFGTRSTVERIVKQLEGKHAMFADSDAADRIRMCEDCRVVDQFTGKDNPMAGGERPRVRTTDDYLREREEIEAARQRFEAERKDSEDS